MNPAGLRKLEELRHDCDSTRGRPFSHFLCPLLFRDEDVELCHAHIVNRAFAGSDRTQTVQRADVDAFFGSLFESEFVKLQHRGQHGLLDVVRDKSLSKKLKPRLVADGEVVEFYRMCGDSLPGDHSPLGVETEVGSVRLGLKLEPSEVMRRLSSNWHLEIEQDLRLPALVSLLKAAHLTLFERVGYMYALSAGGYYVGYEILGRYFLENRHRSRYEQLSAAEVHFRQFASLVRPVVESPETLKGTLSDGLFLFCLNQNRPFAFLVFVATGDHYHGVLLPIFESVESAVRFDAFVREPSPVVEVKLARYEDGCWEVAPEATMIRWPRASL